MAYGFELFNNTGYKVGGSDYANLVFYQKTRITTTAYSFSGLSGSFPQLVIGSAPVPFVGTLRVYRSISGHRCMEQNGRIFSDTIGAVFDCYSFGPVFDNGSNVGIQVFDALGQLTFNAESPYLKLVGVFTDPTPVQVPIAQNGVTNGLPYTVQTPYVEGNKQYAYMLGNSHFYYFRKIQGGTTQVIDQVMARIAQLRPDGVFDTIFSNQWIWENPKADEVFINEIANKTAPMRLMVVDVTGL